MSAVEHISTFNGLLNQLQDLGLQIFKDKIQEIFLLMTLSETWVALVVSFSNSAQSAVHIINVSSQNSLKGGILEEIWSSKSVSYDYLCIFSCEASSMLDKS